MKERKIGEEFEVTLRVKVVENDDAICPCQNCSFQGELCSTGELDDICGHCSHIIRTDHKNVCFQLVEVLN